MDFSHLAGLGEQPLRTEPVHHLDPGRVVGDPQVVVSQRLGALGHFEHRRPAVAPVGVRMHIPLVLAEVEVRLVVSGRLARLCPQPLEVRALSCLDQPGQDLGDARADALDRGERICLLQRLEVRPRDDDRPCGGREGLGSKSLLWILAQQVSDLREHLRGGDRVHLSIV